MLTVCGRRTSGRTDRSGRRLFIRSRSIPTRYSFPSLRQYRAVPENCSKRHSILSFDPTPIGALTRIHAPLADLSSMRAEVVCKVPLWSFHDASTKVITGVRNSGITALTQIYRQEIKLVHKWMRTDWEAGLYFPILGSWFVFCASTSGLRATLGSVLVSSRRKNCALGRGYRRIAFLVAPEDFVQLCGSGGVGAGEIHLR